MQSKRQQQNQFIQESSYSQSQASQRSQAYSQKEKSENKKITKKASPKIKKASSKIKKASKPKNHKKNPKRTGRPPNKDQEPQFQAQSKSYNEIIYHFCLLQLLLKTKQSLKKQRGEPKGPLLQNPQEYAQIDQLELAHSIHQIMDIDVFPQQGQKTPIFLLHSNSVHFLFKHNLETRQLNEYASDKLKLILKVFLSRKQLLTQQSNQYIDQYWEDIVDLVNHPNRHLEQNLDQNPPEQSVEIQVENAQEPASQGMDGKDQNEIQKETRIYQKDQLWIDLKEENCIAYTIACYLHACKKKFNLSFYQNEWL